MRTTRLLSVEACARLADVDPKTIRRWWAAGQFPAPVYLPNGLPRWNAMAVELWLTSRPFESPVKGKKQGQDGTGGD